MNIRTRCWFRNSERSCPVHAKRSDPASPHPEALDPFLSGRQGLQSGILALMRQVHSANDGGQWLEADEFPGLSRTIRGQPNGGHGIFRTQQRLDLLPARFDREERATIRITL